MMSAVKERVLLVDDEPQMLVALEDTLFDEFEVIKTASPDQALRVVAEERDIAVIVSDQRMPKMTGDELFASLSGQSRATRILVTGFADLSAVIRAVNNGNIFAYVTKPWNPADFRLMVRKGAEYFRLGQELAHRHQLLRDLMDNIPDGVYFKDRDLRFTELNRSFAALLGRAGHELVGKRLGELMVGQKHSSALEDKERRILEECQPEVDSVRSWSVNGEPRWISESRAPVRDPDGRVVGLVGIARDVSERVTMEHALRASEDRLQLMFQGSAAGLFDWSAVRSEIHYSKSFARLLGFGGEEGVVGPGELSARLHPADRASLRQAVQAHFAQRTPLNNLEVRLRVADGQYRWFLLSGQAVWDEAGTPTRLAGSITDITIRKVQQERITRLTRIHAMRGETSSAVVRSADRQGLTRELCRVAIDVGHFRLAAIIKLEAPRASLSVAEPETHPFAAVLRDRLASDARLSDDVLARLERSQRPVVLTGSALDARDPLCARREDQPWGALALFPISVGGQLDSVFALFSDSADSFDSEEEKLLEELTTNVAFALGHIKQSEKLDLLAYYDGLTALPNRLLLRERLSQCIAARDEGADKFALLLVDVSRFRNINETLGWSAGDELLTELARLLGPTLSNGDTLARFDGNTFAVLFGSIVDGSEVAQYIERYLLPLTKHPFDIQGTELRVTLRGGISLFPADGRSPDVLIGNAETALRSAKAASASYTFYAPHMNARVAEKLTLETKLRRAIDQEELLLHYQPKVEIRTGRVCGLEALVRWQGDDGVLVSPAQFIPLLEETGMIIEAGRWIFRRAAQQYSEWVARGIAAPRIAVNVSVRQLAQKDFVAMVDQIVSELPEAERGIDLEITESVFVDNLADSAEKLRTLRQRGFQVAIDDFGTGFSSLGYLSRLPIDALKIDRSFIERMFDDAQDMAIVSTIISLAHALDLKVIAEGVETMQQAHHLRLLRCDQIQGYLTARPQRPEQVEALLSSQLLESRRSD